ncbi:MAG: dihydropteroate synthase-like protein, partial [Halobacteriota archaeon]|nr:dihydropteroate synthase-like protein [Halobacteriota archaeon]
MKILVVTGRLAENTVKEASEGLADLITLDIDVAAFITPTLLRRESDKLKSYDLILIPGIITADFRRLEEELGVPIRLGPKHAIDLKYILPLAGEIEFSKSRPACEILSSKRREDALRVIEELEEDADCAFTLKGIKIGKSSSMKVMGEIVDSTSMSEDELTEKILEFTSKGVDIIDIGVGFGCAEDEVRGALEIALEVSNLPVSIDTSETKHMLIGTECGVDMVLSLDHKGLKDVGRVVSDHGTSAVIIADDSESLHENIRLAEELGIDKVIADPVLSPVGHGITRSLVDYYKFREEDPKTPLFLGVGNVTELMDADSIGVNALLAGLGMELEASILFTPEYSDKAKGSISELKLASRMMTLSRERRSTPKDLGLDLLVIKEKHRKLRDKEDQFGENVIQAKKKKMWKRDPSGPFEVYIDEDKKLICAKHGDQLIVGTDADKIYSTIEELGLISLLSHASYLGRELMRAELALKFNRSFLQ